MKKTKLFTAILLVAVLLGGCRDQNDASISKDINENSNISTSERFEPEEVQKKLDEVQDAFGKKYSFDEDNYILCKVTNEEKEEVSINIYCEDKYEIGKDCKQKIIFCRGL